MDGLMAALVAAALAGVGDRPAWLAAILADRFRSPVLVVAMAVLAVAGASVVAALLGLALAPRLTPEARQFLLALALLLQGGGNFFPVKAPDRLTGWRVGALLTSLAGLLILVFADGLQFVVFALAAKDGWPFAVVTGATLGSMAAIAPAALMGEAAWLALPLRAMRLVIALLFAIAGVVIALAAARLI